MPIRKNSLSLSLTKNITEYSQYSDKSSDGYIVSKMNAPAAGYWVYQEVFPVFTVASHRDFNLNMSNKVMQKTDQNSEDFQRKNIHNFLKKISDNNDPINFAKSVFPESKQYLFELLTEVIEEFYQEEEHSDISTESLKGILLFLYSLKKFKEPQISISETGVFYIDWEEEINDSLTIRFKDEFLLEYSLFQPSEYTDKWNIRNGKIHVLDFINDLSKLGIKLHKEV